MLWADIMNTISSHNPSLNYMYIVQACLHLLHAGIVCMSRSVHRLPSTQYAVRTLCLCIVYYINSCRIGVCFSNSKKSRFAASMTWLYRECICFFVFVLGFHAYFTFLLILLLLFFPCKHDCQSTGMNQSPAMVWHRLSTLDQTEAARKRDTSCTVGQHFTALLLSCDSYFLSASSSVMLQPFSLMKFCGIIFTKAIFYFKV